jgi:hypothetical protein
MTWYYVLISNNQHKTFSKPQYTFDDAKKLADSVDRNVWNEVVIVMQII